MMGCFCKSHCRPSVLALEGSQFPAPSLSLLGILWAGICIIPDLQCRKGCVGHLHAQRGRYHPELSAWPLPPAPHFPRECSVYLQRLLAPVQHPAPFQHHIKGATEAVPSAWLRYHWQQSPNHGLPLCFPLTRDLTDNQLVTLPLDGLAGLTHLKLQGNPALSEPFTKESFPKMRYLECCLFHFWYSAQAVFAHSTQLLPSLPISCFLHASRPMG